ncbi:MAG: DNA-3-methyladenine glycosylase [Verrucomicrobiota bacterium]
MSNHQNPLPLSFYQRRDVVQIARELVGKTLWTQCHGKQTSGRIVETEAYCGKGDLACHAHAGKKTSRNQYMFRAGGIAYVYVCYGIHHLFNIVTNQVDCADAVLVRAIEPLSGVSHMAKRRGLNEHSIHIANGPGKLTRAMGIGKDDAGASLSGKRIWITEAESGRCVHQLTASPRVGIQYAGKDAKLPWRFRLKGSRFVSPAA